jgi:hypothetical protein
MKEKAKWLVFFGYDVCSIISFVTTDIYVESITKAYEIREISKTKFGIYAHITRITLGHIRPSHNHSFDNKILP